MVLGDYMNFLVNDHNVFVIVLVTFFASAILVPLVKKAAIHVNAMDIPNKRSSHTKPVPRMGGLAIFGAFILGYMLFARTSIQMLSILIGGFIIVLTGIFDDIKPVSAKVKFVLQIIAACVVVFYGDIVLNHIDIVPKYIEETPLASPSNPSIKLIALVIATINNIVTI